MSGRWRRTSEWMAARLSSLPQTFSSMGAWAEVGCALWLTFHVSAKQGATASAARAEEAPVLAAAGAAPIRSSGFVTKRFRSSSASSRTRKRSARSLSRPLSARPRSQAKVSASAARTSWT